jgi:very-short-patch-repair endonuclease
MNRRLIVKRCRRLRRNQTDAEKEVWSLVRNRQIKGLKFLRQHPFIYQKDLSGFRYFIVDFYCAEKKLVIELDGKIHIDQEEYDRNRDEILQTLGLKIIRFKNNEIPKAIAFLNSL